MAAVAPLLLAAIEPDRGRTSAATLDDVRAALEDAAGLMAAAIAHHGAIKCAIDIALHDLAGKRLGLPVRDAAGRRRRAAADRLHARHRRAGGRRGARAPGGRLPGAQDQGRRAGRRRDARGGARRVYGGPIRVDANTGWTPEEALGAAARARAARRGADRAAVPARRLDQLRWLQERSPLPIVADESAVTIEDLDALVGVDRRRQREAREVRRRRARPGGCSSARASSGSGRSSAAWRRRRSGSRPPPPSSPLADWVDLDGCLLLAEDPVEGLEIGPDKRWRLPDAPGLGLRPGRRPAADGSPLTDGRPCQGPWHGSTVARPQLSRRPRGCPPTATRAVDKSVGKIVEKPLPATLPCP